MVLFFILVLSLHQSLLCNSLWKNGDDGSHLTAGPFKARPLFKNAMSKIDYTILAKSKMKWLIPPLALIAIANSRNKFVPLNKQPISVSTPFFQGWLIRTIDPSQNISSLLITGSFSPKMVKEYKEHYIFCAINNNGKTSIHQELLPSEDVVVSSLRPTFSVIPQAVPLDITWSSRKYGYFHFTDQECWADFHFPSFNISLSASSRIPWAGFRSNRSIILPFSGPEGWLEYTHLLPCHYFIYSVGSATSYNYQLEDEDGCNNLSGTGYSHIEGNHGTFFPNGWVWSQGIGKINDCSFSLVIGRFCIGGLTPINTCLYLRRKSGKVAVIRSIDRDQVQYRLDGISKTVEITASSRLKGSEMNITIVATDPKSFHLLYVPTAQGFSNRPGCQETYTAIAKIRFRERNMPQTESYEIPVTALEFGGSFINQIIKDSPSA